VRRDGVATGSNSYCPVTTVMDDPDPPDLGVAVRGGMIPARVGAEDHQCLRRKSTRESVKKS
jgi:hypothetical protein